MDIKTKELTIGLLGNPALTTGQIKEILKLDEDAYVTLALTRGVTHIYEFSDILTEEGISYRINLLLETEGREIEVMRFINNILEDELSNVIDGVSLNALNILDNCITVMNKLFKINGDNKNNLVYRSAESKLRNAVINGEMIEIFRETEYSIDLDKAYIMQSVEKFGNIKGSLRENILIKNFIKVYNVIFTSLKYYLIQGIHNILSLKYSNTHSLNNCITVEGKIDNLYNFYDHLSNVMTNYGIIANLIDTISVIMPPKDYIELQGLDKLNIILPNVKETSIKYIQTISESNYILYFESLSNYKNNKSDITGDINRLGSIVDDTIIKYIMCEESGLSQEIKSILNISTNLKNTEDLPVVFDLKGNIDDQGYDCSEIIMEFANNDLEDFSKEVFNFDSEKDADEGVEVFLDKNTDIDITPTSVSVMNIVNEIERVGTEGNNPIKRKIVGWGEEASNINMEKGEDGQNSVIIIDNSEVKFELTKELDYLGVPGALEEIIGKSNLNIEGNLLNITKLIERGDINPKEVTGHINMINDIYRHIKSFYQETLGKADNRRKIKKLYAEIMLGDSTSEVVAEILKVMNNTMDTNSIIEDSENAKTNSKLKQKIVKSIIDVMYSEARRYRLEEVSNNNINPTEENTSRAINKIF